MKKSPPQPHGAAGTKGAAVKPGQTWTLLSVLWTDRSEPRQPHRADSAQKPKNRA